MQQIVIVEDDRGLSVGLGKALRGEGRTVCECHSLREARQQLALGDPALVLLDVGLPDGSGQELLREIRARTESLPVILLTANDTDAEVVEGLESGADDYITKPFSLPVLRARVNARLRQSAPAEKSGVYTSRRFSFDFPAMRFFSDGQTVELSKTEQRLLRLLVEHRGVTLSREVLLDRVWTDGAEFVEENALSVTIKRLRDKLDARKEIKTVDALGYCWEDEHD